MMEGYTMSFPGEGTDDNDGGWDWSDVAEHRGQVFKEGYGLSSDLNPVAI